MSVSYYTYISVTAKDDGKTADIFTAVCLPEPSGQFPAVIYRSPYVDGTEETPEEELCGQYEQGFRNWLDHGYAVVFQHCRGRGKSGGDCIPFAYERDDGLALHDWIRRQSFYNGELYLCGASYTAAVHYLCAPFANDIKGAILEVMDCFWYRCVYRNGIYKSGLHGVWYVGMYKRKSIPDKNFAHESFNTLPFSDFSRTVFGEDAEDFDTIISHPDENDPIWSEHYGGKEMFGGIINAGIPILFVTGFYDIFLGGMIDTWKKLDSKTREKSSFVINPYDHGGRQGEQPIAFEDGCLYDIHGDYHCKWIESVRNKAPSPFARGKVTYYQLFGEKWQCGDFLSGGGEMRFRLGEGERTYRYNPYAPASFKGGLSLNFGGAAYQDPPGSRYDIISFHTPEFTEDTKVLGQMKAHLAVRSSCEDTCFYVRVSLCGKEGDFGLRDDITQISNVCPGYVPGTEVGIDFVFDEHAFVIKKGERLRIDVSSSAFPLFIRHTNNRGLYSRHTTAKQADNTVEADRSFLILPVEDREDDQ